MLNEAASREQSCAMRTKLCHANETASCERNCVMLNEAAAGRTKPRHAELVSASLVQMRSRIKFGMTVDNPATGAAGSIHAPFSRHLPRAPFASNPPPRLRCIGQKKIKLPCGSCYLRKEGDSPCAVKPPCFPAPGRLRVLPGASMLPFRGTCRAHPPLRIPHPGCDALVKKK